MYTHRLGLPPRQFLLLGPRGTGKTTWLRADLPEARWYNLLLDREHLRLLRDHMAYASCGGTLSYYRTPSGTEVDFIWTLGKHCVGIEVKASRQWRPAYGRALRGLHEQRTLTQCHVAYLGETPQQDGPVRVWPLQEKATRKS